MEQSTCYLSLNLCSPSSYQNQKSVCCLCCKSGPVGYKFTMQRTGFVPGEVIEFNGEFTNHSRRIVTGVTATLVQVVTLPAQIPKATPQGFKKVRRIQGTSTRSPAIPKGDSDFWTRRLIVPKLPVSGLDNCGIIDVRHELEVIMHIKSAIGLYARIPITIGTIPFQTTFVDSMPVGAIPKPEIGAQQVEHVGETIAGFVYDANNFKVQ